MDNDSAALAANPPAWSEDMAAAPRDRRLLLIAREISEVDGWSIVTGFFSRNLAGWFAATVGSKAAPVQVSAAAWAEVPAWPDRPAALLPHVAGGKFKDDPPAAEHGS